MQWEMIRKRGMQHAFQCNLCHTSILVNADHLLTKCLMSLDMSIMYQLWLCHFGY